MAKKSLRLYRGLSSQEFMLATNEILKKNETTWRLILQNRLKGDFSYPSDLDSSILELHKNLRLEFQYFTDSKKIAEGYAKKVGGLLVEISVPLKDVIEHFDLEFQNFAKRKKQFEIVYRVRGSTLASKRKAWKLKLIRK